MEALKLRVFNQFGSTEALKSPDDIEVTFPYGSDSLVKKLSYGHVKIINDAKGEFEVTLTPFEVQGMNIGDSQNFVAKIRLDGKTKTVVFERSLHIKSEMIDGEERKVLYKK
jgi:hypothetical protein